MNCDRFEHLVALYIEGDLAGDDAARVAAHLEACAGCRALAEDLAASQAAWKTLRAEPVDEEALRQVRQRVLASLPEPRRRLSWGWWGLASAVASALLLVAGVRMALQRPAAVPPPPVVAAVAGPPALAVTPAPTPKPRPRAPRRAAPLPVPQPAQQRLVVKLETSDPNVVIYWIFESAGD